MKKDKKKQKFNKYINKESKRQNFMYLSIITVFPEFLSDFGLSLHCPR